MFVFNQLCKHFTQFHTCTTTASQGYLRTTRRPFELRRSVSNNILVQESLQLAQGLQKTTTLQHVNWYFRLLHDVFGLEHSCTLVRV